MPLNDVSKDQSEFALSETIGNHPIGKLLFRFSLPGVISMLVGATYNIVDTIYVGKLGHEAIAALTVVFPIQLIIVAASAGIGVGAASLISRRLGEKKMEDANRIVGQALGLSIVMGVLVAALIYFVEHPLLRLMGASDLIVKDAYDYIRIIMLGNVFSLIGPVGSNVLRAAGNVRRPMNSMIAGALANIALDPLFIYTFKLGVKGAAIATVISQVIVCIAILTFLFGPRTQFRVRASSFVPSMKYWWRILSVGGPQMVMTLVGSLSMAIAVKIASPFGEASVAAYGVIFRITQFGFMPASGITSAAMPLIG
jgi:putative MATE family efflux protein